jgi:hypothetical protein
MRRWPPFLWLPVYLGSELILLGSHRRWGMLAAGMALALIAFAASLWMAVGRGAKGPRPGWFWAAIGGVALWYVLAAIAAATAGVQYAAAAVAAGIVPMTAVSLWLAVVRQKTVVEGGRLRDRSAAAGDDPHPGIGLDDETPLGDTPEHSDAYEQETQARAPERRRPRA